MSIILSFPKKTFVKRWIHKLFQCPTFWQSIFKTILFSQPFIRCNECGKAIHCYWDGNDTNKGVDFCDDCASKH